MIFPSGGSLGGEKKAFFFLPQGNAREGRILVELRPAHAPGERLSGFCRLTFCIIQQHVGHQLLCSCALCVYCRRCIRGASLTSPTGVVWSIIVWFCVGQQPFAPAVDYCSWGWLHAESMGKTYFSADASDSRREHLAACVMLAPNPILGDTFQSSNRSTRCGRGCGDCSGGGMVCMHSTHG